MWQAFCVWRLPLDCLFVFKSQITKSCLGTLWIIGPNFLVTSRAPRPTGETPHASTHSLCSEAVQVFKETVLPRSAQSLCTWWPRAGDDRGRRRAALQNPAGPWASWGDRQQAPAESKPPYGSSALHTRGCPAWAACAQGSDVVFRSTDPVQDRAAARSAVALWPAAFSQRVVRLSSSRNAFLCVSA